MTPKQQTPASVVERLRIDRAIGLEWPQSARDTVISSNVERYEAAALIERLNAENADLRERVEMFEAEEYDRQQGEQP